MVKNEFLYQQWQFLFKQLNVDNELCKKEYTAVRDAYSQNTRHYHNLSHIEAMLKKALELGHDPVHDPDLFWSIWLHDIIYNPLYKNNEEKSAKYATKLLRKLNAAEELIDKIGVYIIASANHSQRDSNEKLNLFLDLDLLILGQTSEVYMEYCNAIRMEYALIPTIIYNRGRKKVLESLLESEKIFHTKNFEVYEKQARKNIETELQSLT